MGDAGGELAERCQPFLALHLLLHGQVIRHITDDQHPAAGSRSLLHGACGDFKGAAGGLHGVMLSGGRGGEQLGQRAVAQVGQALAGVADVQ